MRAAQYPVFTIGHSNHSPDGFMDLLTLHGVEEIADVRSSPYSRYTAHFNREFLIEALERAGKSYVFLGAELGGRPADRSCYGADGRVLYDLLAETDLFDDGIRRLIRGADDRRIALMCSEKEPLDCHRTILIARTLVERGVDVQHILADGRLESHEATMDRLMDVYRLPHYGDLFRSRSEVISDAVGRQARKMAYVAEQPAAYASDVEDLS